MKNLMAEILGRMQEAASNIADLAWSHGFTGDKSDPGKVLGFLGNTALDVERYGLLYANSAVLSMGQALVKRYGTPGESERAETFARFDYVS